MSKPGVTRGKGGRSDPATSRESPGASVILV